VIALDARLGDPLAAAGTANQQSTRDRDDGYSATERRPMGGEARRDWQFARGEGRSTGGEGL